MKIQSHNIDMFSVYGGYAGFANSLTNTKSHTINVQTSHSEFSGQNDTSAGKTASIASALGTSGSQEEQRRMLALAKFAKQAVKTLKDMRAEIDVDMRDLAKFDVGVVKTEHESLKFSAQGVIKAEGRQINLDLNFHLSRSFKEQMRINLLQTTDPLVISLDGKMPSFSTQTINFDIDNDGEVDQISRLGAGAGFLALDRDGNGKVDRGSELFGAKSGDGFGELAKFDEDQNGWIDENDMIFHKLRIWRNDRDGRELIGLGEVGIGAIFLGREQLNFSFNDTATNDELAKLRGGGFFLYESGKAGLMTQVDMVKQTAASEPLNFAAPNLQMPNLQTNGQNEGAKDESGDVLERLKQRLAVLMQRLASADETQAAAIRAEISAINGQILSLITAGLSAM